MMFKPGQTVKTRRGRNVDILAVLPKPITFGDMIVGLHHGPDGEIDVMTWQPNGRYSHQRQTGFDLVMEAECADHDYRLAREVV